MILPLLVSAALAQASAPAPRPSEVLVAVATPYTKDDKGRVMVRIIFRAAPGGWNDVGGDEGSTDAPKKMHWKVCGGAEVDTRAAPPGPLSEEDPRMGIGVHQLSGKGARLPNGAPILTTGSCADPEGWKKIDAKKVDVAPLARAFAALHGQVAKGLEVSVPPAKPKSLKVTEAWEASDGRRLVAVALRKGVGAPDEDSHALDVPVWIGVEKDGAAKALDIADGFLGAADFDGDGHSELLFDVTDAFKSQFAYVLYAGFAHRHVWAKNNE